jgi:multiple antibiotic resistance protein
MEHLVQALASLFAIANPIGVAPIFVSLVESRTLLERRSIALRTSASVFVILTVATAAGGAILEFFGLSLAAFQAAGGLVIALMGLEMMRGQPSQVQHDPGQDRGDDPALVPLAMPLIAGPGAITTVVTMTAAEPGWKGTANVITAAFILAIVLLVTLLSSTKLQQLMSRRGQRVFLRFMGLILVAIGAQLLMGGVRDFFQA